MLLWPPQGNITRDRLCSAYSGRVHPTGGWMTNVTLLAAITPELLQGLIKVYLISSYKHYEA